MKVRPVIEILVSVLLSAFIAVGVFCAVPADSDLVRYFADNARSQTGSVNVVSAIYLGYRAFDTLGETIVLLLAVAGIAVIREGKP